MTAAKRENFPHISVDVVFAASRFGRREHQVRIAQEIVKQCGETSPSHREISVFIVSLAAAREMHDQGVDEDVGRASVECEDLLRLAGARKNGNVLNTSVMLGDRAEFLVAQEKRFP